MIELYCRDLIVIAYIKKYSNFNLKILYDIFLDLSNIYDKLSYCDREEEVILQTKDVFYFNSEEKMFYFKTLTEKEHLKIVNYCKVMYPSKILKNLLII